MRYLSPTILFRELKSLSVRARTIKSLRLAITFIITLMVISSSVAIFINPALVAASASPDPTGTIAIPSTISQDVEAYSKSLNNDNRSFSSSSYSSSSSSILDNNTIDFPKDLEISSSQDVINSNNRNIHEQYIVVLKEGFTAAERQVLTEEIRMKSRSYHEGNFGETSQSLRILHEYNHVFIGFAMSISPGDLDIVKMIQRDPRVSFAEKDQRVFASAQALPTGVNRVDGDLSSTKSGNGQGTVNADIAILDTGVDLDHPDLNIFKQRTFVSGTSSADDDNGHGTHVAGTAAANDNSVGVVGTAPGAKIWAVKVLDSTGSGFISDIIAAIDYLTENSEEVDVGNMSFGCECESSALDTAINNSVAKGITYVAAAGNSGSDASTFSPANNPNVIAVSAIVDTDGKCGGDGRSTTAGDDDSFADFSNFGSTIDIAAPGVLIESTYLDGSYTTLSGTSMAAPHVAGAATLYKSTHPTASPSDVRDDLLSTGSTPNTVCDGNGHGYFTGDPDTFHEPLLYLKEQSGPAVSSLQARQTNNIVNTQAYYDIQFKTSTAGAIKTIEMVFPPGTYLGAARPLEIEGVGAGKTVFIGGSTLVYEIHNPVSIPAGTEIRLEYMNINNPPTPSSTYTVTVTTRDSSSLIIDGPTVSPVYVMKQIGTNDIANGAITANKLSSSFMISRILQDGQSGWNPDAVQDTFTITDSAVKASNSHVYISVDEPSDVGPLAVNVVCMVEDIVDNEFQVACDVPPGDGSVLRYTVINQP
jgi:subtilisin